MPFSPLVIESSGATQSSEVHGRLVAELSVLSSSSQAVQLRSRPYMPSLARYFQSSRHRVKRCNYYAGTIGGVRLKGFQSSRHRVKRCNGTDFIRAGCTFATFSPLVIESSGATMARHGSVGIGMATFSPLVIESSDATAFPPPAPARGCRPFSPLVIESSGATPVGAVRDRQHGGSFSPLVIESSGATADTMMELHVEVDLSVLSSSSQAVQLVVQRAAPPGHPLLFQSSRHRVKRCNKTGCKGCRGRGCCFQSSRHRVKRCNM